MSTIRIGDRGQFTLLPPFDSKYDTNKIYTVQSLRSLREMILKGDDPFNTIYSSVGILENDFFTDLNNDEYVAILVSENDDWIQIPIKYIDGAPKQIGVEYHNASIIINLEPIPVNMDITYIQEELKEYLIDRLGILAESNSISTSDTYLLSQDEHTIRENIRKSRITTAESIFTKYTKTIEQNSILIEQISKLECYIKNVLCRDGILILYDDTIHLYFNFIESEERSIIEAIYLETTLNYNI